MSYTTLLTCPICESSLSREANSLICEKNHCFDFAKEGYINLLPPQHKKTKEPGDNKEMIRCRKAFLQNGYYEFLAPKVLEVINEFHDTNSQSNFLDSGCGEGYFTDKIEKQLNKFNFYGMDISKEAVRLAAKRNKNIQWFVASSNNIPLTQSSLDVVLKINAPLNFEKLKTKLSNNAIVISVSPGTNHLAKLRETMYLQAQTHKREETPEGFVLLHQCEIEKHISIASKKDIDNLFKMTPYYWNASETAKIKVAELLNLDTIASFNINIYQLAQTKDTE